MAKCDQVSKNRTKLFKYIYSGGYSKGLSLWCLEFIPRAWYDELIQTRNK